MTTKVPGKLYPGTAHIYTDWRSLPRSLRQEKTRWVYLGPDGSHFDLAGRHEGRQGARLTSELGGHHYPFEHLLSESAYQVGATRERTNYPKRTTHLGVVLGGAQYTSSAYRMIEDRWWNAWPEETPGWLGSKTLMGGWRWHQVLNGKTVESPMKQDPAYAGNNIMVWDMEVIGLNPWYAKRTRVEQWTATASAVAHHGYDENVFSIANTGQLPVWPTFIYTSPGRAWVQDGTTSRMQPLPLITNADGYVVVDTDPSHRTLTASKDPIDNLFYELAADFARQSRVLDFFLHDLVSLNIPVWRRQPGVYFASQIPPKTIANLKVRHSNAGGTVICMIPQLFKRPS